MTTIDDPVEADLIARIRGEFLEMPGLSLTIKQGAGCGAATPSPAVMSSTCS